MSGFESGRLRFLINVLLSVLWSGGETLEAMKQWIQYSGNGLCAQEGAYLRAPKGLLSDLYAR